ncbi:uncharacterized protein LOC129786426 isoform X1 [Lutzomyia longipalpis]|uniref:uncharacterized protein LOC129786426 isoform X1 n=1 Tax=Lutzomyia longipalpis TaxID=7200 RepID=UPI002483A60D|nr:uncharacterized protein LOC129786426 isoform X1 [Lutzomyia longipalpis]
MAVFIPIFLTAYSQFYVFFSTSFTIFLSFYLSSSSEAQGQELRANIMAILRFILLCFIIVISRAEYLKCPTHQQHFEKIVGYRPSTHYDMNMNFNLMKNSDVIPEFKQLNMDCWSQCYKDANCFGYIYFLGNNTCYGYSIGRTSDDPYYIKYHKLSLSPDANAVFFQKMCLKEDCLPKMWPITRYPRALVMPQEYERSQKLMSRRECVESCMHEKKFTCHSVIFIPSIRNNFIRSRDPSSSYTNRDIGQCVLNTMRSPLLNGTVAGNYSSTFFRMEYIENQCAEEPSVDAQPSECSFEKYYNRSFIYADNSFEGLSLEECQMVCFEEDSFFCRGFSYFSKKKMCFLHSDDISLFSNLTLIHSYEGIYMRRVECLNVNVACMDDEMVLKYRPKGLFTGQLYLNSRYRNCSTQENSNATVNLKIPIGEEIQENLCGIVRAYERRDDVNRTLISTLVVIQKNPLIRTYDDRIIKIGCVVNNSEEFERVSKEKIQNPTSGRSLVNEIPAQERIFNNDMFKFVKIELFDVEKGIKVSEVNLGQRVRIKIQSKKLSEKFSFRVINLTAISESGEEMLLLDERGCPEDSQLISIFNAERIGKQLVLSSQFRAFKFFDSPRVIFRFFLQFCTKNCFQMKCNKMQEKEIGGKYSMGNETADETEVFKELPPGPTHIDMMFPEIFHGYGNNSLNIAALNDENLVESSEVQYQRVLASLDEEEESVVNATQVFQRYDSFVSLAMYDFLVYTQDARSESLVYGRDPQKINATDPEVSTFKFDDLMCVDTTLLKILFSLFILLLFLILFISYCCIRRYRKLAEYESNSYGSSSLNGRRNYLPKFLQGHRHVKWADENFGFVY